MSNSEPASRPQTNSPLSQAEALKSHALANFFQLYEGLETHMQNEALKDWFTKLPEQMAAGLSLKRWGDLPKWYAHWQKLPAHTHTAADFLQSSHHSKHV